MPAAASGCVRREKIRAAIRSCAHDTHSAGVFRSGVRYTPPTAKVATKKAAMTIRTKSSRRRQSGSVIRSMPRRIASPARAVSTMRVARKNTSTNTIPVQNQGSASVAAIGCGGAPTI